MSELRDRLTALIDRTVGEYFAACPAVGRQTGDHRVDGVLADVGDTAMARRVAELESLRIELESLDPRGLDVEGRADLGMARRLVADERFRLEELRDPWHDPQWALWRGADVFGYVTRDYAPVAERAAALCRHLEQLPAWMGSA